MSQEDLEKQLQGAYQLITQMRHALRLIRCGAVQGTHGSPCIDDPNHDARWAKNPIITGSHHDLGDPPELWVKFEDQCGVVSPDRDHMCTMTKGHVGVHVEIDPMFGLPRFAWGYVHPEVIRSRFDRIQEP